jgi:hypothetical protein
MSPGRTGDDVLGRVHAQMAEDGMEGLIYCHVRSTLAVFSFNNKSGSGGLPHV